MNCLIPRLAASRQFILGVPAPQHYVRPKPARGPLPILLGLFPDPVDHGSIQQSR